MHITANTSLALLDNIRKDGVTIMESYSEKLKNFEKALTRLQESIEEYNQTHSDTVRDGSSSGLNLPLSWAGRHSRNIARRWHAEYPAIPKASAA